MSAPGIEPGPPACMGEHALERLMPKPTELARQIKHREINEEIFVAVALGN